MSGLRLPLFARLGLGLAVGACQPPPPEVSEDPSTGSSSSSSGSSSTTGLPSSDGADPTGIVSSSASGDDGTTSVVADSTGDSGTTVGLEDSGSSSTGEPSPVGCADGSREALVDEGMYPAIAACSGGFWIPGVNLNTPVCDRQGGNDGPFPDGMGCSIDDLCAAGWHLCASRHEVSAAGIGSCSGLAWNQHFFATGQSGEGANTCDDTGTNDVFGCGDVGYTEIDGCAPLNRSTGNLCVELAGPWNCDDANDEVSTLTKTGSDYGGALCCRDAPP